MATLLSGIILVIMALSRLGRLIEYIPLPVTLGFTCGIGITIGTLQIKDFLGLDIAHMPSHYIEKVQAILTALPTINWADTSVGVVTLFVLTQWTQTSFTRARSLTSGHYWDTHGISLRTIWLLG